MGEILTLSQSSLLLLSRSQLCIPRQGHVAFGRNMTSFARVSSPLCNLAKNETTFPIFSDKKQHSWKTGVGIVSVSNVPTTFTVDSGGEGIDVLPDSGGYNDGNGGDSGSNGGGGGGGGGGGDENPNKGGGGGENENEGGDKKTGNVNVPETYDSICSIGWNWRSNGVFEGWKREITGCWWRIGTVAVCCVHTSSFKPSDGISYWACLVCISSGSNGFSFQEVRKGVSCRCCVVCVAGDEWWLLTWNFKECALKVVCRPCFSSKV